MAARRKPVTSASSMGDLLDACFEDEPYTPHEVDTYIPTGVCLLDWALGVPGWPCGRVVEIFGEEGSGKTALALMACKNAIAMGGSAVYLDCEHAFNYDRLPKLGMHSREGLTVRQPHTLEDVHRMVEMAAKSHDRFNAPMVIVWDSFVSVGSKAEVKKDDNSMAMAARLNSRWFPKRILRLLDGAPVCLIVVNQIRDTMNVWNPAKKTTSPGGKALKFYASIRLEVDTSGKIKPRIEGDDPPGIYVNAVVKKSRFGGSHRKANFPFYFERPVDDLQVLIRYAATKKVLSMTQNGRVNYHDKTMLKG